MSELVNILIAAAEDSSDVFLTAGKFPSIRRGGEIFQLDVPNVISEQELDDFRRKCLSPQEEKKYSENGAYDASCVPEGGTTRLRINFFTSFHGSALVARPIRSGRDLHFENLGLPPVLASLCMEHRGIIFICGSTGSGKSTTMGAMINYINANLRKHILTVEDPIEFVYEDQSSLVTQREISSLTGGFSETFRAAMRENPDVIVVGEMRDLETMRVALNAALTGHLVITTLHTNDAVASVERILSIFPDSERMQAATDIGIATNAVIAQRLLPRADGKGMSAACEILIGTPSVRKHIADQNLGMLSELLRNGSDSGMTTFVRSIYKLYQEGIITLESAENGVSNKDEFRLLMKGMENGVDAFRNNYGGGGDDSKELVDMRTLLRTAMKNGASDLVLTVGASPCLRMNGGMQELDLPVLEAQDVQRLLFSVISQRQKVELESNRELDLALSMSLPSSDPKVHKQVRFRLNAFYQRGAIGVVARTIATEIPPPEALGLPEVLMNLIKKKQGLILVTGPTGSGKSTSLASLIDQINRTRHAHIITIEDPIEYVHANKHSIVEQREIHADTKSFSGALKYALRQSPDVIMVGEMRDVETIGSALTAAETGHLVFGTIHTNSAPQTIDRIVDSFPQGQQNQIRQQLSSVILGVVSQRLLKKVNGGGRVAAFEVLVGTSPVQSLVREGKTHQIQSAIETGFKDGMMTLDKSLKDLYDQGLISYEDTQAFSCTGTTTEAF